VTFEDFIAVKIYSWFSAWLHNGGSTVLQNSGIQLPHYMVQQPRKLQIIKWSWALRALSCSCYSLLLQCVCVSSDVHKTHVYISLSKKANMW